MIEIVREAELPAPPDVVSEMVTDVARWPDWFALHKGWAGDVPTEVRKGTKFKHKVRIMGIPGEVSWKVEEFVAPERFLLKGSGPMRSGMEVEFDAEPVGDGTLVVMRAQASGFALRPVAGQLKPWLDVRVDRSLDALTALLVAV
ncbi:MAG: SRPBCC family protein [Solirubrobacteraceae bacterium]|nr:SRPBCC family protein [Solirubrobacteraceae bacterium]